MSESRIVMRLANEMLRISEDAVDSGFRDWNPETDFPVRTGDEEAFSALESDEGGKGEEGESQSDGGLMEKIEGISSDIESIRSDDKVNQSEFVGLVNQMMEMVGLLLNAKPKATRTKKAKEFSTKRELQVYLKEHPKADKSLHKVNTGMGKAVKDKPAPKNQKPNQEPNKKEDRPGCEDGGCVEDNDSGVSVRKDIVEMYEKDIPGYNLKLIAGAGGVLDKAHIENVKDIKDKLSWLQGRIEEGIKESADICKMNPPVCKGNMGITRNHMPQIMDKSIKDLLNSADEKDQRKGQAAVDAGGDPEDDRSVLQSLMEEVKSEGTDVTVGKVPVGELKATQSEILADKTYGIADAYLRGVPGVVKVMNDPIIISSDNHILDGHHRYSAMLTADPNYKMNVIRIGMPMKEFLMRSHEQSGVFRADIKDNIIPADDDVDLGGGPTHIKKRKKSHFIVNRIARDLVISERILDNPKCLR